VTVRVTDNGVPPLSDTNSFVITVLKTNARPALVTGGNQTVNEGALLTFAVSATDIDLPTQRLTFSLDPEGLPAGAAINPTNGLFTWEPDETHGPGVYGITIRATDDGIAPLSDSALITIVVNESNAAPVLAMTNRQAMLGEIVSFTPQATDLDLPPQMISFELLGNSPAGAALNSTNGVFSWTANLLGTNTFTVRATDNGIPAQSSTNTFDIIVTASFQITTITLSNNVVTLNWGALAGRTYGVEYKISLSETDWLPLATNIVASSSSASASDMVGTNTQRLYRIVLQPD